MNYELKEHLSQEIARDARESISAFHAGKLKPQSFEEILTKLRET